MSPAHAHQKPRKPLKGQRAPIPAASSLALAEDMQHVIIYTDGGCWPNPGGAGGWGAYLILDGTAHRKELCGGEITSTNNRMEMMGAIAGLRALKGPCHVTIRTDSRYLRDGITKWIKGWKLRGWMTKEKTPVKNAEMWMELDQLCARHHVHWQWVPGHAGIRGNEKADRLAARGRGMVQTGELR